MQLQSSNMIRFCKIITGHNPGINFLIGIDSDGAMQISYPMLKQRCKQLKGIYVWQMVRLKKEKKERKNTESKQVLRSI